jgi:hypothetical protein
MKLPVLFVCCALVLPVAARADAPQAPDAPTQQALTASYQLACTAALSPTDDKLQAAFGVLAPDFTSTDITGGQVSRADIVNKAGAQLKSLHTTACDQKITAAQSTATGTVVATEMLHLSGSVQMSDGAHPFGLTTISQDTWSNASGRWLIDRRKDVHVRFEMDGSVVMDQGS